MSNSPTANGDTQCESKVSLEAVQQLDCATPFETHIEVNGTPYRLGWGTKTWPESLVPVYTTADVPAGETDFAGILQYATRSPRDSGPYALLRDPDPDTEPTAVESLQITKTAPLHELKSALNAIHELVPDRTRKLPEVLPLKQHLHELRCEGAAPVHEGLAGHPKVERSLFEWQEPPREFLFRVENLIDGTAVTSGAPAFEQPVSLWGVRNAVISFAKELADEESALRAYYEQKDIPRNR